MVKNYNAKTLAQHNVSKLIPLSKAHCTSQFTKCNSVITPEDDNLIIMLAWNDSYCIHSIV